MMVRAADWPLKASNPTHQISHVGSLKKGNFVNVGSGAYGGI
jgi:hypothetical protein